VVYVSRETGDSAEKAVLSDVITSVGENWSDKAANSDARRCGARRATVAKGEMAIQTEFEPEEPSLAPVEVEVQVEPPIEAVREPAPAPAPRPPEMAVLPVAAPVAEPEPVVLMRDSETQTDPVMELTEMIELLCPPAEIPSLGEYPSERGKRS
jgi:hypothetical protein